MLLTTDIIRQSDVQFGTSGARGLVSDFTSDVCAAFTHAFLACMEKSFSFTQVAVAMDNRPSSFAMARACMNVIQARGLKVVYYGVLPTPALAYSSMQDRMPGIMVTGSHIPFDRNGLKFYRPDGEITKADEQEILHSNIIFSPPPISDYPCDPLGARRYIRRYTDLFEADVLQGLRIGIYEHTSAGRDLYNDLFTALGATVICLGRCEEFTPIDTEAVSEQDKINAKTWADRYRLDALFSTDGDGDRPLLADEKGNWLRGDILGLLCADALGIKALAVPVNCNTAIESSGKFSKVVRTKIGSPYVIAESELLLTSFETVAGFEANGGFLLGSDIEINGRRLEALLTRDALLPALMVLIAGKRDGIASLVRGLPARFTDSGRLQAISAEKSQNILLNAEKYPQQFLVERLGESHKIIGMDITDGVRITLENCDIIHLRASGNAPELRCYVESASIERSEYLVTKVLASL